MLGIWWGGYPPHHITFMAGKPRLEIVLIKDVRPGQRVYNEKTNETARIQKVGFYRPENKFTLECQVDSNGRWVTISGNADTMFLDIVVE